MSAHPGYLLDTHVMVWLDSEPEQIAGSVLDLLNDADTSVYISSASLWEASIKVGLGRLKFQQPVEGFPQRHGFQELPISSKYVSRIAELPFHHKDPFDRMLVAQAQIESLILVTRDPIMLPYDVAIISV